MFLLPLKLFVLGFEQHWVDSVCMRGYTIDAQEADVLEEVRERK